LVLCSHVLEHFEDPQSYLQNIKSCLKRQGAFLGLVPINERVENPHHLHKVDRNVIVEWARKANLELTYYIEADPWMYWFQSLYTADEGIRRRLTQALSLALGIPATALGPDAWEYVSKPYAMLTQSEPTQAAFILRQNS